MPEDLERTHHDLLFNARMSIRYHQKRRRFFDAWQRAQNFISIIGGSAAVASLSNAVPFSAVPTWLAPVAMLTVSALGAASLVIDFGRRSWEHADLAKRFIRLESALLAAQDAAALDACRRLRYEIEADEPTPLNVLAILCMNEVVRAHYNAEEARAHQYRVGFVQKRLAPFFDWCEDSIKLPNSPKTG